MQVLSHDCETVCETFEDDGECPDAQFIAAANPAAVLALIAENERLTNRLEVDPRHDYDGISTRDATVKVLDEQVDQLKADNERLRADYAGLARFNPEWDRVAAAQDLVREHMAMVVQLKAEIAGLKTGYQAYERVNAELKAENERLERNRDMWKGQVERQTEELTTLRGEVAEWKETVKFNEKCWSEERGAMIDKLQESRMRIKELDLLFGRYILAMRSALIEEEHGKGPAAAMEWIYNSLAGPGELPPESETDSQAYFDREIVAVDDGMQEVMAFHEGRRSAMSKGEQS